MYREIKGDLIELALQGEFDVITHGCNCFSTMGAGVAVPMARTFGCDRFPREAENLGNDIYTSVEVGNINKLGCIVDEVVYGDSFGKLHVINSYTQYKYGRNHKDGDKTPIDYDALALCLRKINHLHRGKHIGLPQIGCGLAGGDWETVKFIIKEELSNCQVTVVIFNK